MTDRPPRLFATFAADLLRSAGYLVTTPGGKSLTAIGHGRRETVLIHPQGRRARGPVVDLAPVLALLAVGGERG